MAVCSQRRRRPLGDGSYRINDNDAFQARLALTVAKKAYFGATVINGGPTICSRQDFGGLDLPARYSGLIPKAKKL